MRSAGTARAGPPRRRGAAFVSLVLGAALGRAGAADAAQTYIYLGWGSPSTPGFTEENYAAWTHSDGSNAVDNLAYLLYYTPTGFTGTSRDTFEFWTGLDAGYENTRGGRSLADGFGIAIPNIGVEYYYNVERPRVAPGQPGFETFWVSPEFELNFPNGDDRPAGFGAGDNQFSFGGMLEAYFRHERWALTVEPVGFSYATGSLTATATTTDATTGDTALADAPEVLRRDRGGLSATLGVFAAGYEVLPDFFAGIFHSYDLYSFSGSTEARGSEGTLGPTFSWSGLFARHVIILDLTVQTDYVHSRSLPQTTTVGLFVSKHF